MDEKICCLWLCNKKGINFEKFLSVKTTIKPHFGVMDIFIGISSITFSKTTFFWEIDTILTILLSVPMTHASNELDTAQQIGSSPCEIIENRG